MGRRCTAGEEGLEEEPAEDRRCIAAGEDLGLEGEPAVDRQCRAEQGGLEDRRHTVGQGVHWEGRRRNSV